MNPTQNRRILLVDDMPTIHEDFRKILLPPSAAKSALEAAKAALFDDEVKSVEAPFELDSAYQGEEGLAKVQASLAAGRPYAMAFVDMRMPPGWDGVETIEHLWRADPRLQVVICTAYSDTSWEEVLTRLDASDRLLILKKPFDNIEVRQLASALTANGYATRQSGLQIDQLEAAVEERTAMLVGANEALLAEIAVEHTQTLFADEPRQFAVADLASDRFHPSEHGYRLWGAHLAQLYLGAAGP